MDASKPEILTLRVTDLSRGGAGVARDESGRVIFIPLTAPGDLVRTQVIETQKRFAQGEMLEIIEPSPIRQEARCSLFGVCGGCQWQHIPYNLQWKTKFEGVKHALSRTQVPLPNNFEELPAERIWEYRNRVQLRGEAGKMGFFARKSRDRVDAERCEITRPEINSSWAETLQESQRFQRPFKVEIEVLPTGQIRRHWNSGHAAGGFRQVHDEQNLKLQSWVANTLTPRRVLLDLFGGSGNLSLPLVEHMTEIHCVDVSAPKTRPENAPPNLHFHAASVLPWLLRQKPFTAPVSAIVDPPREGLGEHVSDIASALERMGVDEMVAVGCDPDSWARDVSRFVRRGWILVQAAALDLFPQTPHVESLGLLRRKRVQTSREASDF